MFSASPQEVREKTKETVQKLEYNGEFIFAASHHIQPDTPDENILALIETLDNLGGLAYE